MILRKRVHSLYIKRDRVSVTYVRNGGRAQLSSEWRHNENDVIMRTGAASAASTAGARRHNENDVTMIIAGLSRYGDWRHLATGCTALVSVTSLQFRVFSSCVPLTNYLWRTWLY